MFSRRLPSCFVLIHNVHSHEHTKVFFIRLLSNQWHDTAFGKFNLKTTWPHITSQFFLIFLNIYFLWKNGIAKRKAEGISLQLCFSSTFVAVQSLCSTLCNPMDCSPPGLPVHHQLPEFTQTHIHRVGDATQPSHPLSSPSPPAFNLSQHQGLFISIVILFFIYWSVVDVLGKLQVYTIVIHNFKGYIPLTVILKYCLFSPCYTHACSLFYTTVCTS